MNIRTKLENAKQPTLVMAAFLISLFIVSTLVVFDWLQKNEYVVVLEDYVDKEAYETCVEQAKKNYSDKTEQAIEIVMACEKKMGLEEAC